LAGDRKYNANQLSRLFDGIITDGIFQSVGSAFVVSVNSGMTLNVGSGRAWLNYTWTYNDAPFVVTIETAEVALNRIDTVVIEVNTDLAVRANSVKVVKGTPATTPVAPTLANTATLKQYALADVYVGLGVTTIVGGNITNRIGLTGVPLITGILESIDASTLLGQFQADFEAWFANLQDQLDENQAGNLQNQINDLVIETDILSARSNTGWIEVSDSWTYNAADKINVPTDATLKYKPGWGVRFKQGAGYKYFNVLAISATLLTIIVNSDSTLTNNAITDVAFTPYPHSAIGFPGKFNFQSIISYIAGTTDPTSNTIASAVYTVVGNQVMFKIESNMVRGTGNREYTVFSIPFSPTGTIPGLVLLNGVNVPGLHNVPVYGSGPAFNVYHGIMTANGAYYLNVPVLLP
jgi:hypothetical protein